MSASATFSATLFDEWVSLGLTDVVIAPGSRSTPLTIAASREERIRTHVILDERVAAFVALGLGLRGRPAALICTSGTAAANFLPAVVEAGLSGVPMLVCTADRPPELRGVGSPQTIDQINIYGSAAKMSIDASVPDDSEPSTWRTFAREMYVAAGSGPVHLNLPFREPLLGEVDELPAPLAELSTEEERPALVALPESVQVERGIIVAGGASGVDAYTISRIAEALSWPILADPLSGVRSDVRSVANFDVLLRHEGFASGHVPQAVLRFGRPPASKVLSMWVKSSGAPVIQVGGPGVIDPDHNVVVHCSADDVDAAIAQGFSGATGSRWAESWRTSWLDVDAIAEQTLSELLLAPELSEPTVARVVADAAPSNARVVVSSSMPVRDLEWFGGRRAAAHSNRGANGIDGVMSTSLGLALTGVPVIAVIGDLAFVHDSNALWGIGAHDVDLRIIVIDNDGGGIFSFLPQASELPSAEFERLFGTPHGTDLCAVATAHGVEAVSVQDRDELVKELAVPGPRVVRVPSNRRRNVAVHELLVDEVRKAIG